MPAWLLLLLPLYCSCSMSQGPSTLNHQPIVGVLAQEYWGHFGQYPPASHSYIAASYVKYIEGAGARVLPILLDQDVSYYEKLVTLVNGVLLPGGGQDLNSSAYEREGRILLQLAQDLNEQSVYFPVWGTCLGFELMALHFTGKNVLSSCNSYDQTLPLEFAVDKEQLKKSKLFNQISDQMFNIYSTKDVTFNYHKKCLTPETFNSTQLKDTFDILSLNRDKEGLEFISTFEAKNYPIYGVQFHPEKNIYEFVNEKHNHETIPHDFDAILASQFFANFFINECRKNNHSWDAKVDASTYPLIYSFTPEHTIEVESFEQMYFFERTVK